jgi:uncharacterized membrane protein
MNIMYEYTWYQWLLFFYIYCFFGWIFESVYVSFNERRFVNRGFLRLPMIPLYGTGAVMMLWVSLPVKENLVLVYLSGVVAATLLEYVTGWGMERIFKVKYWDYSRKRFQINGYICLSSSIAWGFLTILLTEVIHRPIERYVLGLPFVVSMICVSVTSVLFVFDAVVSVKAALDLAKVLDAMTTMRAELEDLQVQMALLKSETKQRMEETKEVVSAKASVMREEASVMAASMREGASAKASAMREEASAKASAMKEEAAARAASVKEGVSAKAAAFREETVGKVGTLYHEGLGSERLSALASRISALKERRLALPSRLHFYHRSLLRGNPSATSPRFAEALKELRETLEHKNA